MNIDYETKMITSNSARDEISIPSSELEGMFASIQHAMFDDNKAEPEGSHADLQGRVSQVSRISFTGQETRQVSDAFRTWEKETISQESSRVDYDEGWDELPDTPVIASADALGTYSMVRQDHRGPRHGRGGRRRGVHRTDRESRVAPEIAKLMARTTVAICGGSISNVLDELEISFQRLHPSHELPPDRCHLLLSAMTELVRGDTKGVYEVFPAPYFIVCQKVSYSQAGFHSLGAMNRHAVCTWLGYKGRPMCSCVGSTVFRLHKVDLSHPGENELGGSSAQQCSHVNGVSELIRAIGSCFLADFATTASVICDIYVRKYGHTLSRYIHTRPRIRFVHKGSIAVISEIAPGSTDIVQYCPVRLVVRGSGGFLCAFCDTVLVGRDGCHHIRMMKVLRKDEDQGTGNVMMGEGVGLGVDDVAVESTHVNSMEVSADTDMDENAQEDGDLDEDEITEDHKSHLPLSPVNCGRSLKVDEMVLECARERTHFVLTAPETCQICGAHRNPKTRTSLEGVIMCTLGPCIMDVENFKCSREECQGVIETEGREHCVLLHKTTAATHALLRRELMGVALSNGTMNGRLRQYHSQVISVQLGGIISPSPECRSVRTLHSLCQLMLKLMTMDPEKSLFCCETCDRPQATGSFRRPALCVDGINQGYRRSTQVQLHNFVQICESIQAPAETVVNPRFCRPLTALIRRNDTVSVLLKALKGEGIEVTKSNVSDVAAAIRVVSEDAILPQFCSKSICGRNGNDYYQDIGRKTVLGAISEVTNSLFHRNTILLRLLKPLDNFIRKCVSEEQISYLKRLGAIGDSTAQQIGCGTVPVRNLPQDLRTMLHSLEGEYYQNVVITGVCWLPCLRGNSSDLMVMESRRDCLREVLDMYTMFVKGPVTQFIRRGDIRSLRVLGTGCRRDSPSTVVKLLRNFSLITSNMDSSSSNILASCRIIQASLMNIIEVECNINRDAGRSARRAFGVLFASVADVIHQFYSFYDQIPWAHSSSKYALEWKGIDKKELLEKMESKFERDGLATSERPFQEACRSGFYFPNQPQLRPLPFDSDNSKIDGKVVPCTKKYEQNQKSYTPGSVTVSCYCPDSITYGYKVLSRHEGTKSILDTVVTRFPELPWWLIYDFSCGLYQSAVHSLSWAIQNTRIVSDKFHAKNHTCAPGFFPSAYTELDHANTVAHEQRNRGISELGKSLRNSSQHFYIALLAYHTIIMNVRAKAITTKTYKNRDRLLSDYDVEWCYFSCLELPCLCCETNGCTTLADNQSK